MNIFERAINAVSPKWAFERAQYRVAGERIRGYEAASKGTRRTKNWKAAATSQNTEAIFTLGTLRDRSRDLVRNNPYAKRAIEILTTNTIGTGVTAAIAGKTTKKAEQLLQAYNQWAASTDCDANRQLNMGGLQRLFTRTMFESGECIIRQIRRNNGPGKIPIALQVLEPDFLDTNKTISLPGGAFIMQGVEYNASGERVAYWLYETHPGETARMISFVSKRVPADEIIHLYRVDRPGQVRGIPHGVSAFIRMRDLDAYADAQLMRQKIAACFTVFIQDTVNATGAAADYDGKVLEPGAMEVLPPGRSMVFTDPPAAGGYDEYTRTVIREFAIAYGVTYEELTGDLSRVNFSSARMGFLSSNRLVEEIQELTVVPQALNGVWDWFMLGAAVIGITTNRNQPVNWTFPKRQAVDPLKEAQAIIKMVRAGVMSRPEAIRQLGYDPLEVTAEIAADNALLDKHKILSDTDPRADAARKNNADNPLQKTKPQPEGGAPKDNGGDGNGDAKNKNDGRTDSTAD